MDAATLARAMDHSMPDAYYAGMRPAFNRALRRAKCNTVDRVAMFCAQVGEESVGLKYMEEISSGAQYEGRADLGNTQPGDGVRFKGRGPIQITGRANYGHLSQWAHGKGFVPTATFFVDNPAALAQRQYVMLGPVWYWTVARDMNSYADRGDILGATRAVNGGTNGLAERTRRWNLCRAIGPALLPEPRHEEDDMTADETEKMIVQALQSLLHGGAHGAFTHQEHPMVFAEQGDGLGDRISKLERQTQQQAK